MSGATPADWLGSEGRSPKAIASSLGWPVELVEKVFGLAGEANDKGGGG